MVTIKSKYIVENQTGMIIEVKQVGDCKPFTGNPRQSWEMLHLVSSVAGCRVVCKAPQPLPRVHNSHGNSPPTLLTSDHTNP